MRNRMLGAYIRFQISDAMNGDLQKAFSSTFWYTLDYDYFVLL